MGDSTVVGPVSHKLASLEFVEIVNEDEFSDVEFEIHAGADSLYITPYGKPATTV